MTETPIHARGTRPRFRAAAALLCAAVLAACGGGGGGGGDGGGGGGGGGTPHAIAGRVEGLTASGLVLQNNGADNLAIGAAGAFQFTQTVAHGGAYAVTVFTQPQGQACAVAHGSGTANDEVSNIVVSCASNPPPPPPQTQTVGGSISGLTSAGLVLRNNGGDGITIAADATSFTFPTAVARGAAYAVTIGTQPQGNDCTVANGSGSIAEANVTNVQVSCGPVAPLTLVGSNPAANATNVPRDVMPSLTFSAPLDASTAGAAGHLTIGSGAEYLAVAAEPVVQGAQLGMRTPGKLLPGTRYALDVRGGLRGARGERLAGSVSHLFTTADAAWAAASSMGSQVLPNDGLLQAASNRSGDAVVVWSESRTDGDKVLARSFRASTGHWDEPSTLLTEGRVLERATVAVADSGAALLVLRLSGPDGSIATDIFYRAAAGGQWLFKARTPAGARLETTIALHSSGKVHLSYATNREVSLGSRDAMDAGDWRALGDVTGLAARDPGGALSIDAASVQMAALGDGGVMMVWQESGPLANPVLMARRVAASGEPVGTQPVRIGAVSTAAGAVGSLAVEDHGNAEGSHAYVVWRDAGIDNDRILLRRWHAATDTWEGTEDEPIVLAVAGRVDGWRMAGPKVAASWNGAPADHRLAHVLWSETGPNGQYRLRALSMSRVGTPSAAATVVQDLRQVQTNGARPAVRGAFVDRAGNLLVVQEQPMGFVNGVPQYELHSHRWLRGTGTWTAATLGARTGNRWHPVLAGATDTGSAWAASVARDAGGLGVVDVHRFD